jgi:hypothetical protein
MISEMQSAARPFDQLGRGSVEELRTSQDRLLALRTGKECLKLRGPILLGVELTIGRMQWPVLRIVFLWSYESRLGENPR